MNHLRVYVIFLIFACLSIISSFARNGHISETLFIQEEYPDNPFEVFADEEFEPLDSTGIPGNRIKRGLKANDKGLFSNLSSVFAFNDSHDKLSVHWAGKGSDVIICLARNRYQSENSTSSVFISYDYGKTFKERQSESMLLDSGKPSVISTFYISSTLNSHYVFTDVINKYIFTTRDYGRVIESFSVPFKPHVISMHPTIPDIILGMDKTDMESKLWFSDDFGVTWKEIYQQVKAFFWGTSEVDPKNTLFIERLEPGGLSSVLSSDDFFRTSKILMPGIKDFEMRDKYMFITQMQHPVGSNNTNGVLQLWVSYNRQPFKMAQFPSHMERREMHIVDTSEDQVFVCVIHGDSTANLYISDVQGVKFSLSLENILYLRPIIPNSKALSLELHVDIHKVNGLRGVYIATQVISPSSSEASEDFVSVITFDKGGEWSYVTPPSVDRDGHPISCNRSSGCSLHLTQKFSKLYQSFRTVPILSRESAVGLIVASGVIAKSLKGHPSIFTSSDGGVTWREALYGSFLYMFGDYGGIIVAVPFYSQQETDEITYSTDDGETWETLKFLPENSPPIRVFGLMTEPGEKGTYFTLFGSQQERHQWILVRLDLRPVFNHVCRSEDYKFWTPHAPNRTCLLGHKQIFQRRIPHTSCYNGQNYERPIEVEDCPCEREDFECDFGFKEEETGLCKHDNESEAKLFDVPPSCSSGAVYNKTRGYRRIPGDTCKGGDDFLYNPELKLCPSDGPSEFLLVAELHRMSRLSLNDDDKQLQELPLPDVHNVIALDYYYRNHCIFWEDTNEAKIIRHCLLNETGNEVIAEANMIAVEGLALDWLSNNLYFSDRDRSVLEVVKTDLKSGQLRRVILNSTSVDKPRGIAVHPIEGYLFLTDWSDRRPSVSRSYLDGTHFTTLFGSSVVTWPNGITVDIQGHRIFWTDAKLDYIASADFDGKNMKYVLQGEKVVPHPFAVAVFKDWIYFDDWNRQMILMANKYDGSGIHMLAQTNGRAMDLKVFSQGLQEGSNACSNSSGNGCSHFCIPYPKNGHVCLCPEWAVIEKLSNGSEICRCSNKELMPPDGTCSSEQTCKSGEFRCSDGKCVNKEKVCNGVNDCGDFSDEGKQCDSTCDPGQFTCNNSHCIHSVFRCDFDDDCGDGSDETGCDFPKCMDDQFQCRSGRCIRKVYKCDFDDDCWDGSDEADCANHNATCNSNEFSCKSGKQCLPYAWRCDGDYDCHDNSDENNCDDVHCEPWQFHCNNSRCIFSSWHCDGQDDCGDQSDEMNCSQSTTTPVPTSTTPSSTLIPGKCNAWMFTCSSGSCIPFWWRCDGVNDCGDMSDERMCADASNHTTSTSTTTEASLVPVTPNSCGVNRFQCNDGRCIWNSWLCDGMSDCNQGEDELHCEGEKACGTEPNTFRCIHSYGCIPNHLVCNGKNDCGDGSDELGCKPSNATVAPLKCLFNQFMCQSGDCIDLNKRCNKDEDCPDGSDEHSCPSASYKIKNLRVERETINSTSFNVQWDAPSNLTLQYLPSYREATASDWLNTTWTSGLNHTFSGLKSGTDYTVTVYARLKDKIETETPPTEFITVCTFMEAPDPPINVSVELYHTKHVLVRWSPPVNASPKITGYRIYFSPPYPPHIETTANLKTSHSVDFDFYPGTKYTFWVTTLIHNLESNKSRSVVTELPKAAILDPVTNLHNTSVSETSVTLAWNHSSNKGDGYTVLYRPTYLSDYFQKEINVTQDIITIPNLSPGARYVFKVYSFRESFRGPDEKIEVTTTGKPLPIVQDVSYKSHDDVIDLFWKPVDDPRKVQWTYGVYVYSYQNNDFELHGTTKGLKYTLHNTGVCSFYTISVRLQEPFGVGPPGLDVYMSTAFGKRAPPKNLEVNKKNENYMNIEWEPSCIPINQSDMEKIGYELLVKDESLDVNHKVHLVPRIGTKITMRFAIHYGGNYTIQVRTDVPGSFPTEAVVFTAPLLPKISQVEAMEELNGSISIFWKTPSWPSALKDHTYSYYIWLAPGRNVEKRIQYNATKPPFILYSHPFPRDNLHVFVNIIEQHGYQGPLSDDFTLGVESEYAAAKIVLNSTSVVSIAVSISAIFLLLVVILAVFIIRHRRLQRSFLSFANSHYDTRSGAATFSTGEEMDEEEESPMIRGFSDDEPLVVA